jgi:hypothetical protein
MSKPAVPIRAERLLGVADFAAFDLLDQASAGIAGGSLAREAALGGLSAVTAPIEEAPADTGGGRVGINAVAATMLGRVGPACGGGDVRDRFIEGTGGVLAVESYRASTTVGIAPAHLPAVSVEADTHEYVHGVVTAPLDGRT